MFYLEEVMGRVMGWVGYSICSSVICETKPFAADAAKRVIYVRYTLSWLLWGTVGSLPASLCY